MTYDKLICGDTVYKIINGNLTIISENNNNYTQRSTKLNNSRAQRNTTANSQWTKDTQRQTINPRSQGRTKPMFADSSTQASKSQAQTAEEGSTNTSEPPDPVERQHLSTNPLQNMPARSVFEQRTDERTPSVDDILRTPPSNRLPEPMAPTTNGTGTTDERLVPADASSLPDPLP